ncbi:MAG: hypothetical protein LBP92_07290 [Deltaproteobacteria bacterium]|nr:hypothetical protein [Deltaproteobacteria bacterium]
MKTEKRPCARQIKKESHFALVLKEVEKGTMTQATAATILDITERHLRRKMASYRKEGPDCLAHNGRGMPSHHRLPPGIREKALGLYRDKYGDMGPTYAAELMKERDGIDVSHETPRLWLIAEGLWESNAKAPRHRKSRERRACHGELIQMDTSKHHWFGPDRPKAYLISMIDDATSTLYARFHRADSTATNMETIIGYIETYGLPAELYTDKGSHFKVNWELQ